MKQQMIGRQSKNMFESGSKITEKVITVNTEEYNKRYNSVTQEV